MRKAGPALHSVRVGTHANRTVDRHGFSLCQGFDRFSSRLWHLVVALSIAPGKRNPGFYRAHGMTSQWTERMCPL